LHVVCARSSDQWCIHVSQTHETQAATKLHALTPSVPRPPHVSDGVRAPVTLMRIQTMLGV